MNQVLICGSNSPSINEVIDFLRGGGKFFVQHFTHGLEMASGIVAAMNPDLLIVNISDLMDSNYDTLLKIQTESPALHILAMGTDVEYSMFNQKYLGISINQLRMPFQKKEGLAAIARAMGINFSEVSDMLPNDPMAGLMGVTDDRKVVLIVDDNAMTLRSMKGLLEDDFSIMLANSGTKAFRMMERTKPDIILLDYEMPEMDGRTVMQKIRLDPVLFDVPVVFLTGVNDREHISAALALRPAGYLLKPVAKARLLSTIEAVLKNGAASDFIF